MRPRFAHLVLAGLTAAGIAGFARPQPAPLKPQPTDSLDGTWEIVSLIEDGKPLPSEIVKQTMIANARVVVSGQLLAFDRPDGKVRTLAFATDPAASPKRIDLAGAVNLGSKGIYLRDGDTLLMCFPTADTETRPTEFVSLPGKHTVMMTLTRVKGAAPAAVPAPVQQPAPPPAAKPSDDDTRAALVGTWGHQTDDRVVKGTLNPDGTFAIVQTYKKGLKKILGDEERSSGKWHVKDGVVVFTTSASSVRGQVGQIASYTVTSVNAGEVIYVDNQTGGRRIEWKLR